jgi:hypothetical protein
MRLVINALALAIFLFISDAAIASCSNKDLGPPPGSTAEWYLSLIKTSPSPTESRQVQIRTIKTGIIISSTNITGMSNNVIVAVNNMSSTASIENDCSVRFSLWEDPNTKSANDNGFNYFQGTGQLSDDKKSIMGFYTIYHVSNKSSDIVEMGTMIGMGLTP